MLVHSLAWRKLHGVDTLLDHYTAPDVIQQYFAGAWHYQDLGNVMRGDISYDYTINGSLSLKVCFDIQDLLYLLASILLSKRSCHQHHTSICDKYVCHTTVTDHCMF